MATIQRVIFNLSSVSSSSSLSVFTNAPRQDEVGTYLIPVEFKDEQNNTDFTLLSASPNKACLNGHNFEGQQVSDDTVYLQQVDYECILDLQNAGNVLPVSKFIIAKPFFDWTTGQSFCELLPGTDNDALGTLTTMSQLSLTLKVKAKDFGGTYEVFSHFLDIPFLPAFSVDISSVLLTSHKPTVLFTALGLSKVLQSLQVREHYCNFT